MDVDLDKVVAALNNRAEMVEELAALAAERASSLDDEIARQEASLHRFSAETLRRAAADLPFLAKIGALT